MSGLNRGVPMEGHVAGFAKHRHLPEGVAPLAFVVLGYPAEKLKQQDRFNKNRIPSIVW